jgi:hypothetical protein
VVFDEALDPRRAPLPTAPIAFRIAAAVKLSAWQFWPFSRDFRLVKPDSVPPPSLMWEKLIRG